METYQRRCQVFLSTAFGMLQRLPDIFALWIFLHLKVQSRSSGCNGQSHVRIASFWPREEHKMAYTKWSCHCKVVPQPISSSLFQSRCRTGFHHMPYILDKLAHTWTYFSCPNSNNHALGWVCSLICWYRFAGGAIVGTNMGTLFRPSSCHCCCLFVVWCDVLGEFEGRNYSDRETFAQPIRSENSISW